MSKDLELKHYLLENTSFKKVYIATKEVNPNLYITLKGLSIADILIDKDIVGRFYTDVQNQGNNGKFVMDELYSNISKESFAVIQRCLVYDEDKEILCREIFDELSSDIINEIILTIIELTIPSKKKLLSMKNSIDRIEKKQGAVMENSELMKMMQRLIRT